MIGLDGIGPNVVGLWANEDLRRYARWEYGTSDAGWLLRTAARRPRRRPSRAWGVRLRYWLNSFRGFAAFDVRGRDERA